MLSDSDRRTYATDRLNLSALWAGYRHSALAARPQEPQLPATEADEAELVCATGLAGLHHREPTGVSVMAMSAGLRFVWGDLQVLPQKIDECHRPG